VFTLLAVVYASLTPTFEAPDEGSHFLYIHNLLRDGALPILEDRDTYSPANPCSVITHRCITCLAQC
jgi:hypothetical protein